MEIFKWNTNSQRGSNCLRDKAGKERNTNETQTGVKSFYFDIANISFVSLLS